MKYSVWLQLCLGVGNHRAKIALETFGSAKEIFEADKKIRQNSGIFSPKELRQMNSISLKDAEKIVKKCNDNGIAIIAYGMKNYPF